jgi:hypothetical protein
MNDGTQPAATNQPTSAARQRLVEGYGAQPANMSQRARLAAR